jgi:hypothetical protein
MKAAVCMQLHPNGLINIRRYENRSGGYAVAALLRCHILNSQRVVGGVGNYNIALAVIMG